MNEFGEKIDHACSLKIIVLSRDEIVAGPTGERNKFEQRLGPERVACIWGEPNLMRLNSGMGTKKTNGK